MIIAIVDSVGKHGRFILCDLNYIRVPIKPVDIKQLISPYRASFVSVLLLWPRPDRVLDLLILLAQMSSLIK